MYRDGCSLKSNLLDDDGYLTAYETDRKEALTEAARRVHQGYRLDVPVQEAIDEVDEFENVTARSPGPEEYITDPEQFRNEPRITASEILGTRDPHYKEGDVEAIDGIKAALGYEGFLAYCRGNAIKYIWRCTHKGEYANDLRKAGWYIRMANGDDPREESK